MKESRFIRCYSDQLASFHHYFQEVLKRQEPEDIHQLRVTINNLKAFWTLMEVADNTFHREDAFVLFHSLFESAGELRDNQMGIAIAKKSGDPVLASYLECRQAICQQDREVLVNEMKLFDFERLKSLNNKLHRMAAKLTDKIIFKESTGYVLEEISNIFCLKNQLNDRRMLHKFRIQLKVVRELLQVMKELNPLPGQEQLLNDINMLTHQIGRWHDYSKLIGTLTRFVTAMPQANLPLTGFILEMQIRQAKRQEKVRKLVTNFLTEQQLTRIEYLILSKE